jgi:hypothetical protein
MTCGRDGLGPKIEWRFKLRQHRPCHIHQSPVLALHNTILLRVVRNGISMSYPLITKKNIKCVVFKLGAVITSYCQYWNIVLTLHFGGEVDEGLLNLIFQLEEINPIISLNNREQSPNNIFSHQNLHE